MVLRQRISVGRVETGENKLKNKMNKMQVWSRNYLDVKRIEIDISFRNNPALFSQVSF